MGGGEQIYNPVSGINRMITDVKDMIIPMVYKLHPVMRIMGIINLYLVVIVFFAFLFYLYFIRKHRILHKLKNQENYIIAIIVLLLYAVLSVNPLRFGPKFELNFGLVAMPIIAKLMGPLVSCIFGFLQYLTLFLLGNGPFSVVSAFLAAISGMIYARIIYDHRTEYIRCFWAKLAVNVVCNVLLVPMVTTDYMSAELAENIALSVMSNVFLVPFQALVIYIALLAVKKIRMARNNR